MYRRYDAGNTIHINNSNNNSNNNINSNNRKGWLTIAFGLVIVLCLFSSYLLTDTYYFQFEQQQQRQHDTIHNIQRQEQEQAQVASNQERKNPRQSSLSSSLSSTSFNKKTRNKLFPTTMIFKNNIKNSNNINNTYDPCTELPGEGAEGRKGFQGLYKIGLSQTTGRRKNNNNIYNNNNVEAENNFNDNDHPTATTIKILCVLYNATYLDSIQVAYDIYGHRCDDFLIVTTTTSMTANHEDINIHENIYDYIDNDIVEISSIQIGNNTSIDILPILSATTNNVPLTSSSSSLLEWKNLLRVFHHIKIRHNNNQNNGQKSFDFVHFATEKTLVLEENLRLLLTSFWEQYRFYGYKNNNNNSDESNRDNNDDDNNNNDNTTMKYPLYIGGPAIFHNDPKRRYCSPGAGYSLNMAAIDIVLNASSSQSLYCRQIDENNQHEIISTRYNNPHEQLAKCLYDHGPIYFSLNKAGNDNNNNNNANNNGVEGPIVCQNTMDGTSFRFLEYGVEYMTRWSKQQQKQHNPIPYRHLERYHGMRIEGFIHGISPSVVGIHMVDGLNPINITTTTTSSSTTTTTSSSSSIPNLMRRYHAIIQKSCEDNWSKRIPHGIAAPLDNGEHYVHDATYLRRHPLTLNLQPKNNNQDENAICDATMGSSVEGNAGYKGLQKIQIYNETATATPLLLSSSSLEATTTSTTTSTNNLRLLCIVYTHSENHETRVRAIAETYGQRCDGFLAASNRTDPTIGAVHILHEGPETYSNMWLKVRAIWTYVYEHYANDFDFFHIGGDDMYLIPENLKHYLATVTTEAETAATVAATGTKTITTQQSQQLLPLYLGSSVLDPRPALRFCGGGAGYTLNNVALKLLVKELFPTWQCAPHLTSPQEDRLIGDCFRSVGILCPNSQDELGEERYHHLDVDFHAKWNKNRPSPWGGNKLEARHGIKSKEGLGQISKYSISFHLKDVKKKDFSDNGIRRYHAILYGLCNNNNNNKKQQQQ